jgi:Bacterial Ig-like domain (group 3)
MTWQMLYSRKPLRRNLNNFKVSKLPRAWKPRIESLEERSLPSSVPTFGGNSQHTSLYAGPSQDLNQVIWKTPVDLNPQYSGGDLEIHYGAPLVTAANTVLVPVKTGATDGFEIEAFNGTDGGAAGVGGIGNPIYTLSTDYLLPPHNWTPSYAPALASDGAGGTRLYYAGAGGSVWYIANPDSSTPAAPVREVFYTTLSDYNANASANNNYNSQIFIDTPITADTHGDIFFGFRFDGTQAGNTPAQSGYARIDPSGNGSFILASAAANGDTRISQDQHNSAPALSSDETTLYAVVKWKGTGLLTNSGLFTNYGYLVAIDATTMTFKHAVFLEDPRNASAASIVDDGTASPLVAPDGTVLIGVFEGRDPTTGDVVSNGERGWMLHFSADLSTEYAPGSFGWDNTNAIVPASMVPSYHGTSSYLLFSKYNNYASPGAPAAEGWGDGVNKIAILDPSSSEPNPHPTFVRGPLVMREVLTIAGPTPDPAHMDASTSPNAVREWCINTAAVDLATDSVIAPSEDGNVYRWNLANDSLSEMINVGSGIGEAYVPTVINPNNGQILTINNATLFAIGNVSGVGIGLTSSKPDNDSVVIGQTLTFTAAITDVNNTGFTPTGTVTFKDAFANGTTPPSATTLASSVVLDANGEATYTTSSLAAGAHFISIDYSGDGHFASGSIGLVQTVHASATTTSITSSPSHQLYGRSVGFVVTVTPTTAQSSPPTGMVRFLDGTTVLAQMTRDPSGTAAFDTSSLSLGRHTITADYHSDPIYASSQGADSANPIIINANTTTALTASDVSPVFGETVTYTAIISPQGAPGVPADGTVTFKVDGGTGITASVVNGVATQIVLWNGPLGSHTVDATYNGDDSAASYNGSAATQLGVSVGKANTATAISASDTAPVVGATVTYTATIAAASPGSGAPADGTVTFLLNGVQQPASSVSGGVAVITRAWATTGSGHMVKATYNGDSSAGDFNGSTSGTTTVAVGQASTTTTLTSSDPAPVVGEVLTFTAKIKVSSPGSGSPTGTVQFSLNGAAPVTQPVHGGQATDTTSGLSAGNDTITATYSGDSSFATSNSSVVLKTKDHAKTSLSVSPSPPHYFGNALTFDAMVTPTGGVGTPTGSVTFKDGATSIGSATLDGSGHATFSTSPLNAGTHSISASYPGDASFVGSTSGSQTINVSRAVSKTAVSVSPASTVYGEAFFATATVTATAGFGTGSPTAGTVVFTDTITTNAGVITTSAFAAPHAIVISVQPLPGSLASGRVLSFNGVNVTLTAAAAAGVRSISVSDIGDMDIPSGTTTGPMPIFLLGGQSTLTIGAVQINGSGKAVLHASLSASTPAVLPGAITQFSSSGQPVGVAPVNNVIKAQYVNGGLSGPSDSNFTASTLSAGVGESIGKAATSTVITATTPANTPSAPQFGKTVTITARVRTLGGTAMPAIGSVTFNDSYTTNNVTTNTVLGTVMLASLQDVVSITSSGTTATATLSGLLLSTTVTIAGASPSGYNGTFVVTPTGLNTFTYTVSGTVATPAAGAITAAMDGITDVFATLATSTLARAAHTLTVVYNGDTTPPSSLPGSLPFRGQWAPSTSAGYGLVVKQPTLTATLVTDPPSSRLYGGPVVMTINVTEKPSASRGLSGGSGTAGTTNSGTHNPSLNGGLSTTGVDGFFTSSIGSSSSTPRTLVGSQRKTDSREDWLGDLFQGFS